MAESSDQYHEPVELLSAATMDRHRAIVSLMEELEAVDWYQQRIDAAEDGELQDILAHNRDEEKEHAAMSLEWLRRRDPTLDAFLREHLFTEGPIAHGGVDPGDVAEADGDDGPGRPGAPSGDGSLGIGSLREEVDG